VIGDLVAGSIIGIRHILQCIPMSTAIARVYTDEGFVVAADGRAQNSIDGSTNDNTKKIFLVNKPGIAIAYSLAGTVGITPRSSAETIFDVYRQVRSAIESSGLRDAKPKSLHEYVDLVGK
jgi:hypothetical protein